ncbi:MAG: CAP domain-containing protein [Pyrinomonadaceae bacterium]|nr:CAP domain-containing protein [Pyrinomonadaceae bacterium]
MSIYFYRMLIGVLLGCAFWAAEVKAQEGKIPIDKAVSDPRIPTEKKPAAQTSPDYKYSPLEIAVFEEINQARYNPQIYVGFLEDYKKATKGNLISLPNKFTLQMIEGVTVIDEAIGELKIVPKLEIYEISEKLSAAAKLQLLDLQENPALGHIGKNGSNLKTRLAQFCRIEGKAGENICFRGSAARDVVMTFIIDDGVKSRMHRRNVFSPTFKKFGVACGTDKNKQAVCVTVFAENLKDKDSTPNLVEF